MCVCEAAGQPTRHRSAAIIPIGTQNLLIDFVAVLQAALTFFITGTYLVLDVLMLVWHHPVVSTVTVFFRSDGLRVSR